MRFTHAGGPGGQHVNKVATRAELRAGLAALGLSDEQRLSVARAYPSRVSSAGVIRVTSSQSRSQGENLLAAHRRLLELLDEALVVDAPRHATRPSRGSVRRRLERKRAASGVKAQRRRPEPDD